MSSRLIPPENILSISHIRDDAEIARRLSEVTDRHKGLTLRRIFFNSTVCASLWQTLRGRHWQKVELRNVDGDVTTAITVCMSFDEMDEFQIVINNMEIQYTGWFALGMGLQVNTKLKCLRLTTTLSTQGMAALVEGLKADSTSLEILDFSWSTIDEEDGVRELAAGLRENKSLVNLQFMGCSLRDHQVALLVDSLLDHPKLQRLDFNGNKAGPLASASLANLLRSSQTLSTLDVSFQACNEPLEMEAIAAALSVNTSLKIFNLSNCAISNTDAERLCRVLCETNTTLVELLLARNKIDDEGITTLANLLPQMQSLKRLSLWGNPFEDDGAKALAEGLAANFTLEEVDLFRNFPCSEQITYYTALNRGGRRLMNDNHAPLGLWPLVLERLGNLSLPNGSKTTSHDLMLYMVRGPALLHSR
jgi:Ran GTPase-activating protein (RanGAP) involved in mRNA processing and transport